MSNLFYRKPRLLVLTVALILVAGLSALQTLPRAEDPELTSRNAIVFTAWPGADAELIEALVTERVEDALSEFEEVKLLSSSSRAGMSTVTIELHDTIDEVEEVWSRVRDELTDVAPLLPRGALEPAFEDFTITAYTLIAGLTWELEGEPNLAILGRLGEDLADELRALPGTEDSDVFGEVREEVLVEVDPARLASEGLSIDEVAAAVERADSKVPAGRLRAGATEVLVEVDGALESLERVASLVVRRGADGRVVRVGELGVVRKHHLEPHSALALVDGEPGVVVAARMMSGRRVDQWSERARARLQEFEAGLPRGVASTLIFDQSTYTATRLSGLFANFALGAALVMGVVLLMMGWRSALLVGAALPLTTLMVLAGMNALGIPMNQMSVAGLIIALGLLIDNAIVMVDEVRHRLAQDPSPARAIASAVRGLAVPLFGSTVTTALAFMPIVLMPGGAGEFVGSMALSVVLAIVSSLFLALTVVPALTGLLERVGASGAAARLPRVLREGYSNARLSAAYRRVVEGMLARPALAIALALAVPVTGFVLAGTLEQQFFPPAERDQFALELHLQRSSSIAETRRAAERARELVVAHPAVRAMHVFVGESAPKFYYNFIEGQRGAPHFAQAIVQLESADGSIEVVREVQALLDEALPGVLTLAKQIEQGPPFEAPVELHLFGPDLDRLHELGDELRGMLAAVPDVVHTRAKLQAGEPKLLVTLDEEQARLAGLDNSDVAGLLAASLEGVVGGSVLEATEELPVRVRLSGVDRGDLDRIAALELRGVDGWTPLSAVAELSLVPELAEIPHRDGLRSNSVQGFLSAGVLPEVALAGFRERIESSRFTLPQGYRLEWGGEDEKRGEAVSGLAGPAGVLFVLMAVALVLSFDSFLLAGLIGAVGFFSIGLSMFALWVGGYPFGFMAIVGTMGLIGVAINDSIVVLAALRDDPRAAAGERAGVASVVMRNTRHVLATSVTTMAGFAPLLLAGGGFWPPVAVAIGGGVAGATLLALTFVPAGFMLLRRRSAGAAASELVGHASVMTEAPAASPA